VKLTDLRGILRYIPQFREKTFILAVDGAIVTDENFANILLDVAVLRSLNIRVILVHGASAQITALAKERKKVPSDLYGAGITDAETLQLAINASNRLTHEILEGLSTNDLRAACTNAITAHPMASFRERITCSPEKLNVWMPKCFKRCLARASFRLCRRSVSTVMEKLTGEFRYSRGGDRGRAESDEVDLYHDARWHFTAGKTPAANPRRRPGPDPRLA
jgi:hypothetical protein